MDNRRLDLGLVREVQAESFGEPGQRTFRLLVQTDNGEVSLWLEKEQVAMLGSAIEELLGNLPAAYGMEPSSSVQTSFVGELEVRVGTLAVGYDRELAGFTVEASDFESPFDLASIGFLATRPHFDRLRQEIDDIVSHSRPRCVLCGTPLTDEPHFCPPSNGHARVERD